MRYLAVIRFATIPAPRVYRSETHDDLALQIAAICERSPGCEWFLYDLDGACSPVPYEEGRSRVLGL